MNLLNLPLVTFDLVIAAVITEGINRQKLNQSSKPTAIQCRQFLVSIIGDGPIERRYKALELLKRKKLRQHSKNAPEGLIRA